jgi:hypothetical protein
VDLDQADKHYEVYATTEELVKLFKSFGDIRGVDAKVWKNGMGCVGQSRVGRASSSIGDLMHDVRRNEVKLKKR